MVKDAAKANAKEAQAKTKKTDPQAKDAPTLQPSQLEDPPKAKFVISFVVVFLL